MAEMTNKVCGDCGCNKPANWETVRCCDPVACENARQWALARYGVILEPAKDPIDPAILFLSKGGCIVEPYLRPLCTLHLCPCNPKSTSPEYLALKKHIEELELGDS